jgi:ribonuclease Z
MELKRVEIVFLGTGAGMPTKERNVSAIVLNLLMEHDAFWLFDCGEGTQHQILHSAVKLSKMNKIFITHLHGDHLFGLPGLLSSRAHAGGESPMTIYGPTGLKAFIEHCLTISESRLSYELEIIEFEQDGVLFSDDRFRVEVALLKHRIASYGYRVVELDQPGKLNIEKLQAWQIKPGPIYARIKQGEHIQLADGKWINGSDFVGPAIHGRIVVILGDTQYCEATVRLAEGADVLVHEATFAKDRQELALAYDHATTVDAARTASEACVHSLIMTHLSSRYQHEEIDNLLQEAKDIHEQSYIATDFWSFPVLRRESVNH